MAILLNNHGYDNQSWYQALAELLPHMQIHQYPEIPALEDIDYAVVWNHPKGDLSRYPNLKAILLLGAGTEHVDSDPDLPDIPIVRLIDPAVVNDMALYASYWTMHFHRRIEDYRAQASVRHWQRHDLVSTDNFRTSVLGLGQIGSYIAGHLATIGFQAQGWDMLSREIEAVTCYSGSEGLNSMLPVTDVLINCLPLNSGTHHFLNQEILELMPAGSYLINLGRGAVIDDDALLNLLNSKHIAAAALDTFAEEPLPDDSPYWDVSNVYITPHIAGATYARSASRVVAANIERIESGEPPFPIHQPPGRRVD